MDGEIGVGVGEQTSLPGCGGDCRYPRVKHRGGVAVGTICQQSNLCWELEAQRIKELSPEEREAYYRKVREDYWATR